MAQRDHSSDTLKSSNRRILDAFDSRTEFVGDKLLVNSLEYNIHRRCLVVGVNSIFPSPPSVNLYRREYFQAVYTIGMLALIAYDLYFGLWPIFFPALFELSCLLYLTGLKIYFEQIRSPAPAEEKGESRKNTRSSETSDETVCPGRKYSRLSDEEEVSEAGDELDTLTTQDMIQSNYGSTNFPVDNGDEQA